MGSLSGEAQRTTSKKSRRTYRSTKKTDSNPAASRTGPKVVSSSFDTKPRSKLAVLNWKPAQVFVLFGIVIAKIF